MQPRCGTPSLIASGLGFGLVIGSLFLDYGGRGAGAPGVTTSLQMLAVPTIAGAFLLGQTMPVRFSSFNGLGRGFWFGVRGAFVAFVASAIPIVVEDAA